MDTYLYIFFGAIALISGLIHFVNWRQEQQERRLTSKDYNIMNEAHNTEAQEEPSTAAPDTIGLMFKTLVNIGCQPTANEDGTLSVQYQGENFHMEFGGMYARVWDPMWAGVKADDPDMPKIREAVNAANFNFGPTVSPQTLRNNHENQFLLCPLDSDHSNTGTVQKYIYLCDDKGI